MWRLGRAAPAAYATHFPDSLFFAQPDAKVAATFAGCRGLNFGMMGRP
jgi:hypothetical protein